MKIENLRLIFISNLIFKKLFLFQNTFFDVQFSNRSKSITETDKWNTSVNKVEYWETKEGEKDREKKLR